MVGLKQQAPFKHVAIIMDGNGRWAQERSHPRVWGHIRGSHVVSEIVKEAVEQNIEALTLYAFSTENWGRPIKEIATLVNLLKKFLLKERHSIIGNDIQFKVIGDTSSLPAPTLDLIDDLERTTESFSGLKLTFAFGYGGRSEIISACNRFIRDNPGQEINEDSLERNLMRPEVGDVDLLIRTGGDQRISNFLLWQAAYAELFFSDTKWPDFSAQEFRSILHHTGSRERRFGQVQKVSSLEVVKDQSYYQKKNFIQHIQH